jgi:hypothetical protein
MRDLRFLEELGAEFERVGDTHAAPARGPRDHRGLRGAIAGIGYATAMLVVVVVVAVAVSVRGGGRSASSGPAGVVRVVFRASVPDPRAHFEPAVADSVGILGERLRSSFHDVHVSGSGSEVVVSVRRAGPNTRARLIALAVPGSLEFYDWEANALTPSGKPVASLLQTQDPSALAISQGGGAGAPGSPGAGSMGLYQAISLAAKQAPEPTSDNARSTPQYWMFGAPGSAACQIAARDRGQTPLVGQHCLLSGPTDNMQDLLAGLPAGVSTSQGQTRVVPRGIVVLQATPSSFAHPVQISDPNAQFFVLKDHAALLGQDISKPQQSTDQTGAADVTFGFTPKGNRAFSAVTAAIAHRGDLVSGRGETLNEHFAIALDTRLISVPSIDFKAYPGGIAGNRGADISGGFTTESAHDLATILDFGPLPATLVSH